MFMELRNMPTFKKYVKEIIIYIYVLFLYLYMCDYIWHNLFFSDTFNTAWLGDAYLRQ